MSTQLSITRALATIKSLNVRIKDLTAKQVLTLPTAGTGSELGIIDNPNVTADRAEELIRGNWQALNDLITARDNIRAAVIQANAETKVTLSGKEYTIVQLLDAKAAQADKRELVKVLKKNLANTNNVFNQQRNLHEQRLGQVRSEALSTGKKQDDESLKTYTAPIDLRMTPGVIDPLDAAKIIKDLEEQLEDFALNVDYLLSETNAITKITVELGNVKL
jgi:hypothetical protein